MLRYRAMLQSVRHCQDQHDRGEIELTSWLIHLLAHPALAH